MKIRATFTLCALVGLLVMLGQTAQAGVITDFTDFSETGNLLGGSNSREQSFTTSDASVTIADGGSGGGAGQEMFLSDEFPTLAAGDRVSVDWDGTDSSVENEQWGLAITSGEVASGQNLVWWCWRHGGSVNLTVRDASSGGATRLPARLRTHSSSREPQAVGPSGRSPAVSRPNTMTTLLSLRDTPSQPTAQDWVSFRTCGRQQIRRRSAT